MIKCNQRKGWFIYMVYAKQKLSVVFIVVMALFLSACATDVVPDAATGTILAPLTASDVYPDGQIFEPVPESFAASFQDRAATLHVPDARHGEQAIDIRAGRDTWQDSRLIYLDSIPDQNIYLYGYNDPDEAYFGIGLILDVGTEQTIYAFPYRYITNTALAPSIGTDKNGDELYISVHLGSGTGTAISELYIFQMNDITAPHHLETSTLVHALNENISTAYDTARQQVTLYWDGSKIAESDFSAFGATQEKSLAPERFYCGNQIDYSFEDHTIKLIFQPTLYFDQTGVQGSIDIYLESEVSPLYNHDGLITGFDLGKAVISEDNRIAVPYDYVLSLAADDTEVLLNGAPATLSNAPLVQDGTFYLPLEAVAKVLGGTYSFAENKATISLFGYVTTYEIGATTLIVDGEPCEVSDPSATPALIHDTVYIPAKFQPKDRSNGLYHIDTHLMDIGQHNIVIIGGSGSLDEMGTQDIHIYDRFDALPEETISRFTNVETVGRINELNYDIVKYEADGFEIYVMRCDKDHEDTEGMSGRVCAIRFTGDQEATKRGLRVGDSAYRALRLYGAESFTGFFTYTTTDDTVDFILFYTRYYGSQFA
ncbi:MAG: copper amine oxidase N-terminal domain-containing protein [Oscillospiraceae bacterium]|nr:copper amine oxidase N-terminal domain-containing protein [Oscillospiraceae bacterium]